MLWKRKPVQTNLLCVLIYAIGWAFSTAGTYVISARIPEAEVENSTDIRYRFPCQGLACHPVHIPAKDESERRERYKKLSQSKHVRRADADRTDAGSGLFYEAAARGNEIRHYEEDNLGQPDRPFFDDTDTLYRMSRSEELESYPEYALLYLTKLGKGNEVSVGSSYQPYMFFPNPRAEESEYAGAFKIKVSTRDTHIIVEQFVNNYPGDELLFDVIGTAWDLSQPRIGIFQPPRFISIFQTSKLNPKTLTILREVEERDIYAPDRFVTLNRPVSNEALDSETWNAVLGTNEISSIQMWLTRHQRSVQNSQISSVHFRIPETTSSGPDGPLYILVELKVPFAATRQASPVDHEASEDDDAPMPMDIDQTRVVDEQKVNEELYQLTLSNDRSPHPGSKMKAFQLTSYKPYHDPELPEDRETEGFITATIEVRPQSGKVFKYKSAISIDDSHFVFSGRVDFDAEISEEFIGRIMFSIYSSIEEKSEAISPLKWISFLELSAESIVTLDEIFESRNLDNDEEVLKIDFWDVAQETETIQLYTIAEILIVNSMLSDYPNSLGHARIKNVEIARHEKRYCLLIFLVSVNDIVVSADEQGDGGLGECGSQAELISIQYPKSGQESKLNYREAAVAGAYLRSRLIVRSTSMLKQKQRNAELEAILTTPNLKIEQTILGGVLGDAWSTASWIPRRDMYATIVISGEDKQLKKKLSPYAIAVFPGEGRLVLIGQETEPAESEARPTDEQLTESTEMFIDALSRAIHETLPEVPTYHDYISNARKLESITIMKIQNKSKLILEEVLRGLNLQPGTDFVLETRLSRQQVAQRGHAQSLRERAAFLAVLGIEDLRPIVQLLIENERHTRQRGLYQISIKWVPRSNAGYDPLISLKFQNPKRGKTELYTPGNLYPSQPFILRNCVPTEVMPRGIHLVQSLVASGYFLETLASLTSTLSPPGTVNLVKTFPDDPVDSKISYTIKETISDTIDSIESYKLNGKRIEYRLQQAFLTHENLAKDPGDSTFTVTIQTSHKLCYLRFGYAPSIKAGVVFDEVKLLTYDFYKIYKHALEQQKAEIKGYAGFSTIHLASLSRASRVALENVRLLADKAGLTYPSGILKLHRPSSFTWANWEKQMVWLTVIGLPEVGGLVKMLVKHPELARGLSIGWITINLKPSKRVRNTVDHIHSDSTVTLTLDRLLNTELTPFHV
ncbi:hypothetical protein ABW19_dt0207976 [Dactylella cylindrospora]|nr:hypothetical protein ABW19_dt0207976 [Dactylella cylindrospora]